MSFTISSQLSFSLFTIGNIETYIGGFNKSTALSSRDIFQKEPQKF
jgi:hypothetical protein